jgi:hypothetical protein
LLVLMGAHALFGIHILATRILPALRARRVAKTWDENERAKFKKR